MKLPELINLPQKTTMISAFGGYNHNDRINEAEFFDMRNIDSGSFPVIKTRKNRSTIRRLEKANGLYAHNKLAWVDGTDFYYNGAIVGQVEDSKKRFVSMGAFIIIFPDKKAYNTHTGEFTSLEAEYISAGATIRFALCRINGEEYADYTTSAVEPQEPVNGQYWLDISEGVVLKQYSTVSAAWVSVPTVYTKIMANGIGTGFKQYDGVNIEGMKSDVLNGSFVLQAADSDFIVVTALPQDLSEQTEEVTISRKVPEMDFMTECDNRIWGCSSAKHEIYACKLGDPTNWNAYLGIASDSYTATVGSKGDFTGAVTHLGYVIFFKEDIIHKVYGTKPSNYQITDVHARGVTKGSENSLALVNETLLYHARDCICEYTSSLPQNVSDALGAKRYKNANAGATEGKYYISMQDEEGKWNLFVYNTRNSMWYKEDETQAEYFAELDGKLYYISGGNIVCVNETGAEEEPFKWCLESGIIGIETAEQKYINKIVLRMELEKDAKVGIYIKYNDGNWQAVMNRYEKRRRSFYIPIIPRRCDTMQLRLIGEGHMKLFTIQKTIEMGSDYTI